MAQERSLLVGGVAVGVCGGALTVAREGGCGAGVGPSDSSFPQIIKKLIERKQAQIRKVYPGPSRFKEGGRQIPVGSAPGGREQRGSGWGGGRTVGGGDRHS